MNEYGNVLAFANYMGAPNRSLPELQEVESMSPRVLRVLGGNPGVVSEFRQYTAVCITDPCCRCICKGLIRISSGTVRNVC